MSHPDMHTHKTPSQQRLGELDVDRFYHGYTLEPDDPGYTLSVWYKSDGSVHGTLPCDPYSRLLYLGRGLRPDVGTLPAPRPTRTIEVDESAENPTHTISPKASPRSRVTLADAVVGLLRDRDTWEGTATELLSRLKGAVDDVPEDAIRLSKALAKLSSPLSAAGIRIARTRTNNSRRILLTRG